MKRSQVMKDFERMKDIASVYSQKKCWERALRMLFFASGFMYYLNQKLYDTDLENLLEWIVKKNIKAGEYDVNEDVILFFDSFGRMDRGLTAIYIKALYQMGFKIVYVTHKKERTALSTESKYIYEKFYVEGRTYLQRIECLAEIMKKVAAKRIFMYLLPDDIVAVGAFALADRETIRYQINLTDHAFWLGRNISDIIINFREFGACVCKFNRDLPEERLRYLPYYPLDILAKFEGLGKIEDKKYKIFSGGNLYKTYSRDNQYYDIVETILKNNGDIGFIFCGDGNASRMRRLCRKYPEQFIYERERKDFYEIMKRCTVYFSTYPYNGGLMTQYAILAKKVPVTLTCKGIEKELTIRDEEAFWNYSSREQCIYALEKLLYDEEYRNDKQNMLDQFLISEQEFRIGLSDIIFNGKSGWNIKYDRKDLSGLKEHPVWYYNWFRYSRLFFRRDGFFMVRYFPCKFIFGFLGRVSERINHGK